MNGRVQLSHVIKLLTITCYSAALASGAAAQVWLGRYGHTRRARRPEHVGEVAEKWIKLRLRGGAEM